MNMEFLGRIQPDADELRDILLLSRSKPSRVHIGELHIDREVAKEITEKILGEKWIEPVDEATQKKCLLSHIRLWQRLGFDCLRLGSAFRFSASISFPTRYRETQDTAILPGKNRRWVEENSAIINSWEDFENYHWPSSEDLDLWPFEFTAKNLPEGMGIWGCLSQGFLETVMFLAGYENLCFMLYDKPDLVQALFDRVGNIIMKGNEQLAGLDKLIGFFQGDDMGFKTGTLFPPEAIRKYVLPWHKKLADFAHRNNLLYVLHSCGKTDDLMEGFITDVKIDAKHSFDDGIMPVCEFKKKYDGRLAVIGGIDVDKLCRLEEKELRRYVRRVIEECTQTPGYVLGSGNSIANYVPVDNFLIMIEEGFRFK